MKILVVCRYSPMFYLFHQWKGSLKVEISIIGHLKYQKEYDEIGRFYSHVELIRFSSEAEVQENLEKCFLKFKFNSIFYFSELDVLPCARIREKYDIPGQKIDSALNFRDKLKMKLVLDQAGIDVTNYQAIENEAQIKDFIDQKGFPIIIKPRQESGSVGVFKVGNESDLEKTVDSIKNNFQNLMVEKFINGRLIHVDGIFFNAQIDAFVPFKTVNNLNFHQIPTIFSVEMKQEDSFYDQIKKIVFNTLTVLDCPSPSLFHIELFLERRTKKIWVNEAASRLGGGRIQGTVRHVLGFDLVQRAFQLNIGMDFSEVLYSASNSYYCGFMTKFPFKKLGQIKKLPPKPTEMMIKDFQFLVSEGEYLTKPSSAVDYFFSAILTGENRLKLLKNFKRLNSYINHGIEMV